MSNVRRFFNFMMMLVIFTVILVVFAIGYKTFYVDAGHAAMGSNDTGSHAQTAGQANANGTSQADAAVEVQTAGQPQYAGNVQAPANGTPAISQKKVMQRNKENLEEIISNLNDTMQYLTMESMATGIAGKGEAASGDANAGGNQTQAEPTQDMGLKYDAEKMAQLHSSMYKIALGKALLNQLQDNLQDQEESADQTILNPAQYYSGLYNQTIQNKALLKNALSHMGDVSSLVNLNPYVSKDGIPYDSERMGKLHQSVLKLAEALAAASALETRFEQQAETYAAYVYTPMNPAVPASVAPAEAAPASHPATAPDAGASGGLNLDYIAGILPYAFGAFFLLGMIGYILNLAKSRSEANNTDDGSKDIR